MFVLCVLYSKGLRQREDNQDKGTSTDEVQREKKRIKSWLRHCATSRKVAGSIPDVIGIFIGLNLLAAMWSVGDSTSNRNECRGKDSRCVGLTTLPPFLC